MTSVPGAGLIDSVDKSLELTVRIVDRADPHFRAEALRQSSLVAKSDQDADDQAFIEAVTALRVE